MDSSVGSSDLIVYARMGERGKVRFEARLVRDACVTRALAREILRFAQDDGKKQDDGKSAQPPESF